MMTRTVLPESKTVAGVYGLHDISYLLRQFPTEHRCLSTIASVLPKNLLRYFAIVQHRRHAAKNQNHQIKIGIQCWCQLVRVEFSTSSNFAHA